MSKLAKIQQAIAGLPHKERAALREWLLNGQGCVIDPEEDSPELEAALLKAVRGPHKPLTKESLYAIAGRASAELRGRRRSHLVFYRQSETELFCRTIDARCTRPAAPAARTAGIGHGLRQST
jgi:hypothetical protein